MSLFNQTKLLDINGGKYAFETHHLLLCEIDEVYEACFNCLASNVDMKSLYSRFGISRVEKAISEINEYIESGLFFSKGNNTYDYSKEDSVGCFSFPPQHNCNLACKYCFANHGENYDGIIRNFTDEVLEQSFNFVCNKLYSNLKKFRIDFVSGGEPLLNFDVIKKTVRIRNEYQDRLGKPIEIFLATNAVLLTKEHLDFFNKNNVNLGISLDGNQKANDSCRVFADGNGTYSQVLSSINKIQHDNTLSRRLKNIWGLSVIHANNLNVEDILRHHDTIGLKSIQMKVVRLNKDNPLSINNNNIDTLIRNYEILTDCIIDELQSGKTHLIGMFLNDNDYFGKILRRLLARTPVIYRCGAGKNKVSICANGDIYPCDSFVGNNLFILGNIFKDIDLYKMNMFYEFSIYKNEYCNTCWIRHLCGGDCYYNSYLCNKSINVPDSIICKLNKCLAELAIRILIEVEKSEPLSQYFDRALNTRTRTY